MSTLKMIAVSLLAAWTLGPPVTSAQETPAWVVGSSFGTANGVAAGEDGLLYVASFFGRAVVVLDPDSGAVLDSFGPESMAGAPDDLAFGPDGSLYWTAFLPGEVVRRAPDGATRAVATGMPGVNAVAFSADGRLFVTRAFIGDELYELDPTGVREPRLVASDLGGLNAMAFGPDGFLYGPSTFGGLIWRIDVDTGERTAVIEGIAGMLAAVTFDARGRLHALNAFTREVLRVDPQAGTVRVVATVDDPSVGLLDNFTFDAQDRLFVATFSGSVLELHRDGSWRTVTSGGGLSAPGGVAVLAGAEGESVFVADFFVLRELDGATGAFRRHERAVPGLTPLAPAFTVSADGERLITSSWFANAVQVWDPATGEVLTTLAFDAPLNAVRFGNDLVVAEGGSGSVVRVDGSGERTTLADGLGVPAGLAASDDDLWVGDRAGGAVYQLVADGALLDAPVTVATGLAKPEGIALDGAGRLLVVETGAGRLSAVDLRTGEVSTVAEGLELGAPAPGNAPPTWRFAGVAVGPSGSIYVSGDDAAVLYRLAPGARGERRAGGVD